MADTKSTILTVLVHPVVNNGLRIAAEKEHCSLANMIIVMIRDYCGRTGITIQEQKGLPLKDKRKP